MGDQERREVGSRSRANQSKECFIQPTGKELQNADLSSNSIWIKEKMCSERSHSELLLLSHKKKKKKKPVEDRTLFCRILICIFALFLYSFIPRYLCKATTNDGTPGGTGT